GTRDLRRRNRGARRGQRPQRLARALRRHHRGIAQRQQRNDFFDDGIERSGHFLSLVGFAWRQHRDGGRGGAPAGTSIFRKAGTHSPRVMPGLDPGIHDLVSTATKTWMAGSLRRGRASRFCPAMTKEKNKRGRGMEFETLVQSRKSVRGFKKKAVAR